MAYQPFDLTGKVALITGGNGGIGLGFGEAIAAAGGDVSIWGRNDAKNAEALERLKAAGPGGTHTAFVCDVADEQDVDRRFAETLEAHGRVDGCFANAGVSARGTSFTEMTIEEWRHVMSVNMEGAFFTFRAATRHMVERSKNGDPFGRLVGTASLAALSGPARNEHYAFSKGGLVSMMNALAIEFARHGVTANAILPGWIETEMTEKAFADPRFHGNVMPRMPMRRWGRPEDFGGIAVYIMSEASGFHTAESFLIDGGYWVF
ncbi:SDR family NAD(P)-dependent oxidoreductase [Minwuia thermotolerans]|uniref:2-deoxy-D-gluconate 3-dehydrogenase n=1 Tax=Minwuia thermotolerans TaxID=2056226 RepID=A0A2M9FY57_9PROT|nr:SDR family NAD(P)-dependent oxidoreductase [Minwuia thermotolerans]PJK28397.1 2-deoxy-D-gluconate 3-dehydrogenase [Minwuia thermotolerans]